MFVWVYFVLDDVFNRAIILPNSVVMCYFIALASVYGKSVNLLKTQLKLVRMCGQILQLLLWVRPCCVVLNFCLWVVRLVQWGLACSFSNDVFGLWSTGGPWQAVPGKADRRAQSNAWICKIIHNIQLPTSTCTRTLFLLTLLPL